MSNELNRLVSSNYLILHRENYLKESSYDIISFSNSARQLTLAELERMLLEDDWRIKIVAIYSVIALKQKNFIPIFINSYFASGYRLVRRPMILAMIILDESMAIHHLENILMPPFREDCWDEYAAALDGLRYLKKKSCHKKWKQIKIQLDKGEFDISDFEKSQKRFRKAIEYWKNQAP